MHPSRNGHQFIADSFAHLLRNRGFEIGIVDFSSGNNRSRKDSILWMIRNGVPWFFKRSFDLMPAMLLLMAIEFFSQFFSRKAADESAIYYPEFSTHDNSAQPAYEISHAS